MLACVIVSLCVLHHVCMCMRARVCVRAYICVLRHSSQVVLGINLFTERSRFDSCSEHLGVVSGMQLSRYIEIL